MASMPGDAPVLVDSAGCGAALKDYGHLLGTPEAERFAARVLDVSEWLAPRVDRLPRRRVSVGTGTVAVQDPCHLRHVQKAHHHVRTVLRPFVDLVELDDEGLCCGAGGAYAAQHPELAGAIRDRKVEAIAPQRRRRRGQRQPGLRDAPRRRGPRRAPPLRADRRRVGGADGR